MAQVQPEVKLIRYSIDEQTGIKIYTYHLRYWRPIHSELMTHRKFGRNARSSRAVPNKVLLREPIVEPMFYGSNRPGMSAGDELKGWRRLLARTTWLALAHTTRAAVRILNFAGLHKQWSNRPLEWFGQIDVLVTTTDLRNWYALRDSDAAMPEIRTLARLMKYAAQTKSPQILKPGEWHLPYIGEEEADLPLDVQQKISVARCARISYKPFDGTPNTVANDIALHDKLVVNRPVHASPAEHQATPDRLVPGFDGDVGVGFKWQNPHLHGNLRGFIQYRKTLPNEWLPD
jgi:hypothetical protein